MPACARSLCWTLSVILQAPALAATDPLAGYYGNTIICLGVDGTDAGHLWLHPDGHYVLFAGLVRTGRFSVGPVRPDDRADLCLQPPAPAIHPPAAFAGPEATATRFASNACVMLGPHDLGDRWADPARPGRPGFMLIDGQR